MFERIGDMFVEFLDDLEHRKELGRWVLGLMLCTCAMFGMQGVAVMVLLLSVELQVVKWFKNRKKGRRK